MHGVCSAKQSLLGMTMHPKVLDTPIGQSVGCLTTYMNTDKQNNKKKQIKELTSRWTTSRTES